MGAVTMKISVRLPDRGDIASLDDFERGLYDRPEARPYGARTLGPIVPPGPAAELPASAYVHALEISREPSVIRLGIDDDDLAELGPYVEARAADLGLTVWLDDLAVELPRGETPSPSAVWAYVTGADRERRAAEWDESHGPTGRRLSYGLSPYVPPWREIAVVEVDGRRVPIVPTGPRRPEWIRRAPFAIGPDESGYYDSEERHLATASFQRSGRPAAAAFVHIGVFLAWAIDRHVASGDIATLGADKLPGPASMAALRAAAKGCLSPEHLSALGRTFADAYYAGADPQYLVDWSFVFDQRAHRYAVADSAATRAKAYEFLDRRWREWLEARGEQSE
jgi:hypothetical protein